MNYQAAPPRVNCRHYRFEARGPSRQLFLEIIPVAVGFGQRNPFDVTRPTIMSLIFTESFFESTTSAGSPPQASSNLTHQHLPSVATSEFKYFGSFLTFGLSSARKRLAIDSFAALSYASSRWTLVRKPEDGIRAPTRERLVVHELLEQLGIILQHSGHHARERLVVLDAGPLGRCRSCP
jgi:hypothetical protein